MTTTHFDYGTRLNKDSSLDRIPSGTAVAAFIYGPEDRTGVHYTAFLFTEKGKFRIEAVTDDANHPEYIATKTPIRRGTLLGAALSDVIAELKRNPATKE